MTRQAEHQKRQREAGWTTVQVWLSPDDQDRLDVLVERYGSKTQAVRVMLAQAAGESQSNQRTVRLTADDSVLLDRLKADHGISAEAALRNGMWFWARDGVGVDVASVRQEAQSVQTIPRRLADAS